MTNPDRFFHFRTPGAQEWWYFDALSDDGRDALVLVWYAGLPFDPDYGVGTLRHLADPSRHPAPEALDHGAIGLSWYRDGKTIAYALNGFRKGDFSHRGDPFGVEIAGNRLDRDEEGYALRVDTPAVDGKERIVADLRFRPAAGTRPLERDLGREGSPHWWILAAADCRVEGDVAIGGRSVAFRGRGYHDHNAGSEEISRAIRRWHWGRAHHGERTEVYYHAEPRLGAASGLWITLRDGAPEMIRESVRSREVRRTFNPFGVPTYRGLLTDDPATDRSFGRWQARCVDGGPFYQRWLSDFQGLSPGDDAAIRGISELLDTRNLNRRLYNWMIPYRLKRPGENWRDRVADPGRIAT